MRHAAFRGGASSGGRAPAAGWLGSSHTGLRAVVHRRPPGRRSLCALFLLPARRGGLSPTGSSAGRQLTGGPAPPAGPARPPAPPAGAPSIRHFTKPWLGHECRSGSGDCSGTENEPPITNEPKENKTGPPRRACTAVLDSRAAAAVTQRQRDPPRRRGGVRCPVLCCTHGERGSASPRTLRSVASPPARVPTPRAQRALPPPWPRHLQVRPRENGAA